MLAVTCLAAVLSVPVVAVAARDGDNPHWNKAACQACHVDVRPAAGRLVFKGGDPDALCEECHGGRGAAAACRHESDIAPGALDIPGSHAGSMKDGRIVCTTCHDLAFQCLNPNPGHRGANPGFVRARQSRARSDACFACHDPTVVEQLNPHQMDAGAPSQPTCTFCHATMPAKGGDGWLAVDFHVEGSLNDICVGCHRVTPHPALSFGARPTTWDHLVVPSAEILGNMKAAEAALDTVFPLDPNTGQIHCATCHDPHPESLEGYPGASMPGTRHRLRVTDNCQACHDL